jgi:hypothetical protein
LHTLREPVRLTRKERSFDGTCRRRHCRVELHWMANRYADYVSSAVKQLRETEIKLNQIRRLAVTRDIAPTYTRVSPAIRGQD